MLINLWNWKLKLIFLNKKMSEKKEIITEGFFSITDHTRVSGPHIFLSLSRKKCERNSRGKNDLCVFVPVRSHYEREREREPENGISREGKIFTPRLLWISFRCLIIERGLNLNVCLLSCVPLWESRVNPKSLPTYVVYFYSNIDIASPRASTDLYRWVFRTVKMKRLHWHFFVIRIRYEKSFFFF